MTLFTMVRAKALKRCQGYSRVYETYFNSLMVQLKAVLLTAKICCLSNY